VGKQNSKLRKTSGTTDREALRGALSAAHAEGLPSVVNFINRSALGEMVPGDIIFLDEYASLRESFAPSFIAILACPVCGTPSLLTATQYSGATPVVCGSKLCSELFRIVDEAQIVYLPPS
jgi:uncharacterized protein YbaR (Trm112 family)